MNPILKYVITRITTYLLTLFLAITVVWWLFHLLPGDPIATFFLYIRRTYSALSMDYFNMIEVYRQQFGFDKPLLDQYFNFLSEFILHGNLGPSLISFPVKVQDLLLSRLPWSIGYSRYQPSFLGFSVS